MGSSFSESLRALMDERDVSGSALARRIPCDRGLISRFVNGKQEPSRRMARRLDDALGADGKLLALIPSSLAGASRKARAELPVVEVAAQASRRDFVMLSGSMVAGNILSAVESELDRINMALSRGSAHESRIEVLEGFADDLGTEIHRAGPGAALRPALSALSSARALLEERQPTRYQARLVAVCSKLSTVIGEQTFNLGQFRQAREWHKTAQYAAYDGGSQYLADISIAQQAYGPIYSGDAAGALSLVSSRLDRNPVPSPAVAHLLGIRARAHAVLGDSDGFRKSIERAWDCLDRSAPELIGPGIFSFRPASLAFHETTGAVALNDLNAALDAAERALALFQGEGGIDKADSLLVRLSQATALAKAGEVPEACVTARAAVTEGAGFYNLCVRTYARTFSSELREYDSPDTREWHELLAEVESRQVA